MIIGISVDLSKLDKSKIVEGKNGGKYYNMTVFVNDKEDQYGKNVSVTDTQTKEERQAGEKKTYIGNGKVIFGAVPVQPKSQKQYESGANSGGISDLPF